MVGAEVTGCPLSGDSVVEHPAQRFPIDRARVSPNTNDSPRELIHHHENPVARQHDVLAAEQVDAPEAVLCEPDERQPGRPSGSRFRSIVFGQYSADHVLVNLDAEGPGNDERDPRAAETWIAALELHDRTDELL